MTTLRTNTTTEFRKRVYFDGSPTHVFNEKYLSPLMKACMYGRSEQVKLIIEEKPLSVIERDAVFKTALHYCAENDEEDADCAKLLLEADPSIVDIPDDDGHTALHLAVIAGNLPLVRLLLISGRADPNKRDAEGHSTVHWATVCADVNALELVLSHGGRANSADVNGGYAIHYAAQMCGVCRSGDVRNVGVRVLQLLLSYAADVNVTDKHGRQPILWAASAGSADAIITLVNGRTNVESQDKDGLTALHCAASRGHVECVDALITLCGCEVDTVDNNGCSALFYAVTLGHADATEMLLEYGANPDRQDGKGRTPAHCGAFKGQLETVRLLAEHGGDLWLRNSKGGYPLHDAMRSGRKELVLWLLSLRPESVDYYDNDGKRPLHIAALNNNLEMSKIILDNGASINPVMKIKGERMTPLDVALRKNNGHLAKFLNLYGGKPASKLNKTLSKQQSTVRIKTKRCESRRNSYSSDSISRKYRNGGGRKKHFVQRKGESPKPNKSSKGRVVQVHIRADVLTKTRYGKSRDNKVSYGSTIPKTQRRKTTTVNESKEYFSENDLCYGGDDFDCEYEDDYEDDEDEDDGADGQCANGQRGDNDDDDWVEQADHCKRNRHRNRRHDNRATGQSVRRDPKTAGDGRRRPISRDKTTAKAKTAVGNSSAETSATAVTAAAAAAAAVVAVQHGTAAATDGVTADAPPDFVHSDQHADVPSNLSGDVGRDDRHDGVQKPNSTVETGNVNDGGVKFTDGVGDGRIAAANVGQDSRYERRTVSVTGAGPETTTTAVRDTNDSGPSVVTKERDEKLTVHDDRGGCLPSPSVGGDRDVDKTAIERSTSREGGKTPTAGQSKNSDRAIVEVLDRVNTPQTSSTLAAVGGGGGGGGVGGVGGVGGGGGVSGGGGNGGDGGGGGGGGGDVYDTTAFSVLPDEGKGVERACACPECRKKPPRSSSTSKKLKSRIPRLNNYYSLAPTSDLNTISVTKAVQLSSRKYNLERLIFYQLSELKRLQIRAGKSDERVLVKRLIEEYGRTGLFTGLRKYDGPFSFKRFEKYLYDQLLVLQKQSLAEGKSVIPTVQSIDEVEKLTGALRRIEPGKTVLENPYDDYLSCIRTTNRCFHATHAYTGVPCAAYIPKFKLDHHQMPKPVNGRRGFLPDIRQDLSRCLRNVDPSKPITLQLGNGPCTQAIDLPTDKLDKNKRYYVTFTIKGAKGHQNENRLSPVSFRGRGDDRSHPPLAHHTHAKSF